MNVEIFPRYGLSVKTRQTLLMVCAALAAVTIAAAAPAVLTVTPERAPLSGSLEISCELPQPPPAAIVVVSDAYRGTELLRSGKTLVAREGRQVATVRLNYRAEPGVYAVELRDVRGQKLAGPGYFLVPGITKRGSWWLFDGQPMTGAIRTWGGVDGDAEMLVKPLYKGGYGFNVLTLELHAAMLGTPNAEQRRKDWAILERNGAYAFLLPGELGWAGLSGPLAVEKWVNEKGEPGTEGGFMSSQNRAATLDLFRRINQNQFPSGVISPAFLGFCAFENHMGFRPWYDYSDSAIQAYRREMQHTFKTVEAYNQANGTSWASWEQLDAPREAASTRRDWVPWTDYRFRNVAMFYQWLQPEMRKIFPDTYLLPIVGGMLGTMQNDAGVVGNNAFQATDEREVAKVMDVIGTEGWADYVAGHSDLLIAATDPKLAGVAAKPIWPDYYTYLSIGPDIASSLILKRVDQIGHGATGTFLEHVGAVYNDGKKNPAFLDHFKEARDVNLFLCRNANLLIGSRVIPDVAVVTPTDTLKYGRDKTTVRDADNVNAGIFHALTRLHRNKRLLYQDAFTARVGLRFPAVLATAGALTSDRFLKEAEQYVRQGGKLYLEGLPDKNEYNEPTLHRLDAWIGAKITAVAATTSEMVFRGQTLAVARLAAIQDLAVDTRVLATFRDGSPAVVSRELGEGEVVYSPNWVVRDASYAYIQEITSKRATPFKFWAGFDTKYVRYYGGILAELGAELGIGGVEVESANADEVRTSVLETTGATTLLSVVNYGDAKNVSVTLSGMGDYLRDLRSSQPISFLRKGSRIQFKLDLPRSSWTFVALAKSAAGLDEEVRHPLYSIHEVPRRGSPSMASVKGPLSPDSTGGKLGVPQRP